MARHDHDATFWDHLEVFRGVLIRSVIYIAAGATAGWMYRQRIFEILRYPAEEAVRRAGIHDFAFRIFDPAGGIVLMMQASLLLGVLLSAPLWLTELAFFIAPGLKPGERRLVFALLPLAIVLFLSGAGFCYYISPTVFAFLFTFTLSLGVTPEVTLVSYLYFLMRLVLVFGLVFEMPLVVMLLVQFGVVSSRALLRAWRLAVVIIFIFAAVATPTTDPFTMLTMALPMTLLYFLSIGLGRLVERRKIAHAFDEEDPYGLHTEPDDGLPELPSGQSPEDSGTAPAETNEP
ncbi:MAG: twin-arginine translocase subunit TatC [Armatimonadia bacterium]